MATLDATNPDNVRFSVDEVATSNVTEVAKRKADEVATN
jgi:hypothetical protein